VGGQHRASGGGCRGLPGGAGGAARERVPLEWATTQGNLGSTLARLGEREGSAARLEEAVAANRAALEEFTRERVPLEWARTQTNLGNALRALGERTGRTDLLAEALAVTRDAHAVYEEAGMDQYDGWFAERIEALEAVLAAMRGG
jgi:tetratricopeptide (TPR) repeat protein